MDLSKKIRTVPHFPKQGILFYDVMTLFQDAAFLKAMEGALTSAPPALRSQFERLQGMMGGGRGRGRRGGR